MNLILKMFLILLKILNYWFLVIPGKFSFFALVGYNLFIYFYFGKWSIDAVQENLGNNSFEYFLFLLFIAFPMFWSFICCWADAKMTSSSFGSRINSTLNSAISYRNGQMGIKTPQDAFDIYKETVILDQMNLNRGNEAFDKAIQGFNAKYGNSTPQEVLKAFTEK